jgi:hypothetical protein
MGVKVNTDFAVGVPLLFCCDWIRKINLPPHCQREKKMLVSSSERSLQRAHRSLKYSIFVSVSFS